MQTFGIDGRLEKLLEDLTVRLGSPSVGETINKAFHFLEFLDQLEKEGGQFFCQKLDGSILNVGLSEDHNPRPLIVQTNTDNKKNKKR